MSERERMPKLKENSKLIKLKVEVNGKSEGPLGEDEVDITDINNLMYAAATTVTQSINHPSKRSKNRRNKHFWKIRMQRQVSNWRKELSITAETGTESGNGKLARKKWNIFKKYRMTNAREIAQLTETLKQKVQEKSQRIRRN